MSRPLILALVFMTRIPVPVSFEPRPEDWGRSVVFFPLVGLLIGLLMAGLYQLFPYADPHVLAVVLVTVWVLTTGGLHLDGLADLADAWVGGSGDREKTLAIMKDSRSGPMAVMALILVLLGKFTTLAVIAGQGAWELLLLIPVLGRSAILLMLITTPYVRPQGIGVAHADYLPRVLCTLLLILVGVATAIMLEWDGIALLALLGMGLIGLRQLLLDRLGGITGDTLGATCELAETMSLMFLVLLAS